MLNSPFTATFGAPGSMRMKIRFTLIAIVGLAGLGGHGESAQQVADTSFDARAPRPAYAATHLRVLFDEAHHNFHTTTGRYRPFATLIASHGYRVTPNTRPFSAASLRGHDVLVIANALGPEDLDDSLASRPAFTDRECDAVREWVRGGGALLLMADHAPFGEAAEALGKRFGVDMSKTFTKDPELPRHRQQAVCPQHHALAHPAAQLSA